MVLKCVVNSLKLLLHLLQNVLTKLLKYYRLKPDSNVLSRRRSKFDIFLT